MLPREPKSKNENGKGPTSMNGPDAAHRASILSPSINIRV